MHPSPIVETSGPLPSLRLSIGTYPRSYPRWAVHFPVRRSSQWRPTPKQRSTGMKYMLLIHQGDAPTPYDAEAWGRLSEDEQKAVYAGYGEINQTPGVSPGVQMQ